MSILDTNLYRAFLVALHNSVGKLFNRRGPLGRALHMMDDLDFWEKV